MTADHSGSRGLESPRRITRLREESITGNMTFDLTAYQLSAYGLTAAHHRALNQQADSRRRAKRLSRQCVALVLLAFLAASCAGGLAYLGKTQMHATTTVNFC